VLPAVDEQILGSDWLVGIQCRWDFAAGTICIGNQLIRPMLLRILALAGLRPDNAWLRFRFIPEFSCETSAVPDLGTETANTILKKNSVVII